jgi:hypothetical protein
MKDIILGLAATLICVMGVEASDLPAVSFEWFNLSTNEIWVTAVIGFPKDASPGRLTPNRSENRLERSEIVISETVRIKDRITIMWKNNGALGWLGGLKTPGGVLPGTAHQVELKRDDLGIPAKLNSERIRFTYLGDDKWRVRLLK